MITQRPEREMHKKKVGRGKAKWWASILHLIKLEIISKFPPNWKKKTLKTSIPQQVQEPKKQPLFRTIISNFEMDRASEI